MIVHYKNYYFCQRYIIYSKSNKILRVSRNEHPTNGGFFVIENNETQIIMKNRILALAVIALSFSTFSCTVDEVSDGSRMDSRITNPTLNQEIITTPIDSTMMSTGDPITGEPDIIKPPRRY